MKYRVYPIQNSDKKFQTGATLGNSLINWYLDMKTKLPVLQFKKRSSRSETKGDFWFFPSPDYTRDYSFILGEILWCNYSGNTTFLGRERHVHPSYHLLRLFQGLPSLLSQFERASYTRGRVGRGTQRNKGGTSEHSSQSSRAQSIPETVLEGLTESVQGITKTRNLGVGHFTHPTRSNRDSKEVVVIVRCHDSSCC